MEAPKRHAQTQTRTQDSKAQSTLTSSTTWHALHIRGFIGVSGPYDLVAMKEILHKNGLDKSIVSAMFCNNVAQYSPTLTVQELAVQKEEALTNVRMHFPATCIIHGDSDKTVPFQISLDFFEKLKALNLEEDVEFRLYPSWSHTDPILEAPFAGNHLFHRDAYNLIKRWAIMHPPNMTMKPNQDQQQLLLLPPFDESHAACRKICPLFLVQIARFCNPF